jgi:hypothetical protein
LGVPFRSNDPNSVIGEFGVGAWNLQFRHVTGGAVLRSLRASCAGVVGGSACPFGGNVATEAAVVVELRITLNGRVRVVAGKASDAGVAPSPATAQFKTVGLKAQRRGAFRAALHYVCPGAMAGAAKVHGIKRSQLGRVQDLRQAVHDSSLLHRRGVLRAGPVTSLAGNPWNEVLRIELPTRRRSRVMTSEAKADFVRLDRSAYRFFQVCGWASVVPWGDIQRLQSRKVTKLAFVEGSAALENVSFANHPFTKCPCQGGRDRPVAFADGEQAGVANAGEVINVGIGKESEPLMRCEDLRVRRAHASLGHRRSFLYGRLRGMTFCTGRRAQIFLASRRVFGGPPTRGKQPLLGSLRLPAQPTNLWPTRGAMRAEGGRSPKKQQNGLADFVHIERLGSGNYRPTMHRFCASISFIDSGSLEREREWSRTKMRQPIAPADRKHSLAEDERWKVVERIAASPGFQKSARLRELLLYLTEETLQGRASQLTEHEIGHAIFGKPADYSPLDDSSVRVHARQLRLRLHEYFDSVGHSEPMIVEIPKGSYAPVFRSKTPEPAEPITPLKDMDSRRNAAGRVIPWILCAILVTMCAYLGKKVFVSHSSVAAKAPDYPPWPLSEVFDPEHRTHIVVADVNYGMMRIIAQKPGSLEDYLKPDFPRSFLPTPIPKQQALIMNYISGSGLTSYADVSVLTSLTKLAGDYRDRTSVRFARDIRLRDLDDGNYIFLGSPGSNPWVQLFQGRLNFQEAERLVGAGPKEFVNKDPHAGEQKAYVGLRFTGTAGEDYADIALLPSPANGTAVLILQGLQQEGTEAAGRFLADANQRRVLREALGLSSDPKSKVWFEALIRTKAVDGAPNAEAIVAARLIP